MSEHECEIDKQMSEILNSKRAQSGLFSNLWFHDISNRMKIRRQAEAKVMGLGDDYPVGTYPSHGGVIINEGGGFWKGLALAGLTSAGLGAGIFAMNSGISVTEHHEKTPVSDEYLYEIEIIGTDTGVEVKKIEAINDP